ncbi:MAG: 4Fe-4S dicluster domain-containing protein [Gammaproteobacteria bacterium]|nr:4Fe-4S dicluster domain-containing protein [Gammaproteobacteria bacterium]
MNAYELNSVEALRAHLAADRRLYEPRPDGQGGLHWQTVAADDAQAFEPGLEPPPFSAKAFFFPEREAMFRFERGRFVAVEPEPEAFTLFGLRACDLTAIAYQDRFFARDGHYQARREAALLVGMDCAASCTGGFCAALGSGPAVGDGLADLVLIPGASWRLLVNTAAGRAAVSGLDLKPAPRDWTRAREQTRQQAAAEQGDAAPLLAGIAALNAGRVPPQTWEALGPRCLGCSGCTSVCPTCSCFAPLDLPTDGGLRRERVWDSCLYEGFQKEASGHNGSPSPGDRVRRYWFHKFGDGFKREFGRYGCVGCGRCDRVCPGGIGARVVLKRLGGA